MYSALDEDFSRHLVDEVAEKNQFAPSKKQTRL